MAQGRGSRGHRAEVMALKKEPSANRVDGVRLLRTSGTAQDYLLMAYPARSKDACTATRPTRRGPSEGAMRALHLFTCSSRCTRRTNRRTRTRLSPHPIESTYGVPNDAMQLCSGCRTEKQEQRHLEIAAVESKICSCRRSNRMEADRLATSYCASLSRCK